MAIPEKATKERAIKSNYRIPPDLKAYLKEKHADNQTAAVVTGLRLLQRHEAAQCPCLKELEQAS